MVYIYIDVFIIFKSRLLGRKNNILFIINYLGFLEFILDNFIKYKI